MAKRKRRAFTKEFKAEAVGVVQASGQDRGGGGAGAGSHGDGPQGVGTAGTIDGGRGQRGH